MERPKRQAAQRALLSITSSSNSSSRQQRPRSANAVSAANQTPNLTYNSSRNTQDGIQKIKRTRDKSHKTSLPSFEILPHGLGINALQVLTESSHQQANLQEKELRTSSLRLDKITELVRENSPKRSLESARTMPQESSQKKRLPKKTMRLGESPFPDLAHPTTKEAEEVERLLSVAHGQIEAPESIDVPSRDVAGCGEVKYALEALIRTMISAHTTMSNANEAIKEIVKRYKVFKEGPAAGCIDWNDVRRGGREKLENAIRVGGLQSIKSRDIIRTLDMIYDENQKLRTELQESKRQVSTDVLTGNETMNPVDAMVISPFLEITTVERMFQDNGNASIVSPNIGKVSESFRTSRKSDLMANLARQILLGSEDILTVDYIHSWPVDQVFEYLQKFPSVGVKTAACVLLFCMQKPLFAVDTHVFRICKWLGWAPPNANRDQVFFHCDFQVPDRLKYKLHQLLILHGKTCIKCQAAAGETHPLWNNTCCLEHLLKRTGTKKGSEEIQKTKRSRDEPKILAESQDDYGKKSQRLQPKTIRHLKRATRSIAGSTRKRKTSKTKKDVNNDVKVDTSESEAIDELARVFGERAATAMRRNSGTVETTD